MGTERDVPWLAKNLLVLLYLIVGTALSITAAIVGLYLINFGGAGLSSDQSVWAEFGDYVGGTLNSALAFLALLALLLTLRVQSIELKMSTEELRNSALALQEQNNSVRTQIFENTFFQLIRMHTDIVSGIDLRTGAAEIARGRDCFRGFYNRLSVGMDSLARGDYLDEAEGMVRVYSEFFNRNESDLGHYFRHLYRIYKFIDESDIEDKFRYSGIVRAQLSSYELILIFYNGIGPWGGKFKPLLERFAVFKNMNYDRLFASRHKELYADEAYGL